MVVRETYYQQGQGAVGNACGKLLMGTVLFVVSVIALWFNEGAAVQTAMSLDEGLAMVTHLPVDVTDNSFNNRLIHVAGTVSGAPELNDGELGVSAVGTVLERVVQMKQWKEHERKRTVKLGNGQERVEKEWTYSKEWASQPINSDNFKEGGHANPRPSAWPVRSMTKTAPSLNLGVHRLDAQQVGRISQPKQVPVQALLDGDVNLGITGDSNNGASRTKRRGGGGGGGSSEVALSMIRQVGLALTSDGNQLTRGNGNNVGDMKVTYKHASPTEASVVALQKSGGGFGQFHAPSGDTFDLFEPGILDAPSMFAIAHTNLAVRTWAIRGVGWLLMFVGLASLTSAPLALVEAVPLLGGFAASFLGSITCCASLLVSMGLSLIIIALAWLWYRPVVGVALIAAACIPLFLSTKNTRARGPTPGSNNTGGGSGGGGYSYGGGGGGNAGRPDPSAPPAPDAGGSASYSYGGAGGARARGGGRAGSQGDAPPAYSY